MFVPGCGRRVSSAWLVICHDIETDERSLPVLRLLERREGEAATTEILLRGKSFYRIGKFVVLTAIACPLNIAQMRQLGECA